MVTVAQVLNTRKAQTVDRHILTTTAGASADGAVDIYLPDGTVADALVPSGLTLADGDSVFACLAVGVNVVLVKMVTT
jgi:hypothetical protein